MPRWPNINVALQEESREPQVGNSLPIFLFHASAQQRTEYLETMPSCKRFVDIRARNPPRDSSW